MPAFGQPTMADIVKKIESGGFGETVDITNSAGFRMKVLESCSQVCGALKSSTKVKTLILRECELTDDACEPIADMLKENHSIENLDLQQNKIGSGGAIALAKGLAANHGVRTLNLMGQKASSGFGEDCLEQFIQMYDTNVTLTKIQWRLDSRKAWALSKLMTRNNEIKRCIDAGRDYSNLLPGHMREQNPDLSKPAAERAPIKPPTVRSSTALLESTTEREEVEKLQAKVEAEQTALKTHEEKLAAVSEAAETAVNTGVGMRERAPSNMIREKKWDGDGVPVEDSNMAGVGSDEDKALRKEAAGNEPAWATVGKEAGIQVWRIEDFKVVAWPRPGYFHTGDSYIVLQTIAPQGESEEFTFHIFFWLGKETSTDEKGTAAYKTVELDDFLDGKPTQHREVQHYESHQFKELFSNITYLEGGVDSGFNQVGTDTFVSRLFQVRKTNKDGIRVKEVTMARESLNAGDVFILDAGTKIYVWEGAESSAFEKSAANTYAERMESERDGKATATHDIDDDFWAKLGGEGDVTAAGDVTDKIPEADYGEGVLYRISDCRELSMEEVARGELKKEMLESDNVMLLDAGTEIFLWIGAGASRGESRNALNIAMRYLKVNGKPDSLPICMFQEGQTIANKHWNAVFSN